MFMGQEGRWLEVDLETCVNAAGSQGRVPCTKSVDNATFSASSDKMLSVERGESVLERDNSMDIGLIGGVEGMPVTLVMPWIN